MVSQDKIQKEIDSSTTGAKVSYKHIKQQLIKKLNDDKPFNKFDISTYLYTQAEMQIAAWYAEGKLQPDATPETILRYAHKKATEFVIHSGDPRSLDMIGRAILEHKKYVFSEYIKLTTHLLEEEEGNAPHVSG